MSYLPERPIEPPEPKPDCVCDECGNWFYGDEPIFISEGRFLCAECFRDEIESLSAEEIASAFGVAISTAQEVRDAG